MKRIKEVIERESPGCVAVELDMPRYYALKSEEKASSLELIKSVGFATFAIFSLLRYLQRKLGGMVGVAPGTDMLAAADEAKRRGISVAFIDMDIRTTAYRFKTKIPLREKLKLITHAVKAAVFFPFGRYFPGKGNSIDLSKVPGQDFITHAMKIFEKEFPAFYSVLVTERNEAMAKNLIALSRKHEKIVAVVGAAHADGIERMLDEKITKSCSQN